MDYIPPPERERGFLLVFLLFPRGWWRRREIEIEVREGKNDGQNKLRSSPPPNDDIEIEKERLFPFSFL